MYSKAVRYGAQAVRASANTADLDKTRLDWTPIGGETPPFKSFVDKTHADADASTCTHTNRRSEIDHISFFCQTCAGESRDDTNTRRGMCFEKLKLTHRRAINQPSVFCIAEVLITERTHMSAMAGWMFVYAWCVVI